MNNENKMNGIKKPLPKFVRQRLMNFDFCEKNLTTDFFSAEYNKFLTDWKVFW